MNLERKQRVAILGATGMIGSGIYDVLKNRCDLLLIFRNSDKLDSLYQRYGQSQTCRRDAIKCNFADLYQEYVKGFQGEVIGPHMQRLLNELESCDWVINAAGITKAIATANPAMTLFINGTLPHILSGVLKKRLIHITTDCVYNGTRGAPYTEAADKSPVDFYGLSKSIGEPNRDSLVIRTSTIGREIDSQHGLLEWFLSQAGKQINGFKNHLWNGITTRELGRVCDKVISGVVAHPGPGTYHIFSTDVTKYQMVTKFKETYQADIDITPTNTPTAVDRRLATKSDFNGQLEIPSFDEMVNDLLPEIADRTSG